MSQIRFLRKKTTLFGLLRTQRGSAVVDYVVILVFTVLAVIAVIAAVEDKGDMIFDATANVVGNFGKME